MAVRFALVSLSLAIVLVSAPSRAQLPNGTYRGQLALRSSIHDEGVAYIFTQEYELELQLELSRTGAVHLHVVGTAQSQGVTLDARARPSEPRTSAIDEEWAGTATQIGREISLHLERVGTGPSTVSQDLRCGLEGTTGTSLPAFWRCEPTTHYEGMPWNDPVPAYLRVPFVFGTGAGVRAEVIAPDRTPASVEVGAPRPTVAQPRP